MIEIRVYEYTQKNGKIVRGKLIFEPLTLEELKPLLPVGLETRNTFHGVTFNDHYYPMYTIK
jgi:hypothetical protein